MSERFQPEQEDPCVQCWHDYRFHEQSGEYRCVVGNVVGAEKCRCIGFSVQLHEIEADRDGELAVGRDGDPHLSSDRLLIGAAAKRAIDAAHRERDSFEVRLAEMTDERDMQMDRGNIANQYVTHVVAERDAAIARADAIRKYARHHDNCPRGIHGMSTISYPHRDRVRDCTCGLTDALDGSGQHE